MSVILVTPPQTEPVTLTEARAHLRIDDTAEDSLIGALIAAARVHVENATRRVLIEQHWKLTLDAWPRSGQIDVPIAPVIAIDAVSLRGVDGVVRPLPLAACFVDTASTPARLRLIEPASLPPLAPVNAVTVELTAGYGPSAVSVPQPLREAIMLLVARWYEGRDGIGKAIDAGILDQVRDLIAPYRQLRVA